MLAVPAMRVSQFGVDFYQALLSAADVDRLVRFETLGYGAAAPRSKGARRRGGPVINWELLEKRIASSEAAYQRPIIRKKIAELVAYYAACQESRNLPAIPGAVIIASETPLEFSPARGGAGYGSLRPDGGRGAVGMLQLPEQEGSLRAIDGQHRLLALQQFVHSEGNHDFQVPAVIFDRLAPDHVVELFVTINAKHTRLNPSHLISLAGRRLYQEAGLALAHDVVRDLNERADSPLRGEIRMLGVGRGKVSQAPLAEEIKLIVKNVQAFGGDRAVREFSDSARAFFLAYFKQIARAFPIAWSGRKYSVKTATALRAFLRVAPDVIAGLRDARADLTDARAIGALLAPWSDRIGDSRFETEGEWRRKQAGGTRATVELLARELREGMRPNA